MILFIDTNTTSLYYAETVQLEGIEYLFEFQWSTRESAWYLNIYDQDENPLASGAKLVIGTSLLRRFTSPQLPPGALFCVDLTGQGLDIVSPGELGVRVPLVYVSSDDPALAELAAA